MPLNLRINDYINPSNGRELLLDALGEVDPQSFACLRVVAIARDNGPWALYYGEAVLAPIRNEGSSLDLGRMVVVSECIGVPEFIARLGSAFQTGRFHCGSIEIDTKEVFGNWSFRRYPSHREYSRWPCVVAEGYRGGNRAEGWVGPFATVLDGRARFFQSGIDVIRHVTTFPVFHRGSDARVWSMSVILEDHRARISQVERDGERLMVCIEGYALDGLLLAGEIYDGSGHNEPISAAVRPEMQFPLPPGPVDISMGVVGEGAEVLDYMDGRLHAPSPVAAEGSEPLEQTLVEFVEKLVRDGENAQCEFKPWFALSGSNVKLREVAKTAVAMANSEGGAIMVGIDDDGIACRLDGAILGPFIRRATEQAAQAEDGSDDQAARQFEAVGLYGRELRDQVQKIVEPSIDLHLEVVHLSAIPVLLMQVRVGTRPPYMTDTREIYIRRNASNRRPTREEHMRLIQMRLQGT